MSWPPWPRPGRRWAAHPEPGLGAHPKINISVKPSALYSQLRAVAFRHSVERAKERLREIYRRAVKLGAHVILTWRAAS